MLTDVDDNPDSARDEQIALLDQGVEELERQLEIRENNERQLSEQLDQLTSRRQPSVQTMAAEMSTAGSSQIVSDLAIPGIF
jgi:hypothetical protein